MNPLINIIVPIYNVDGYLRRCVDSLLSQTYRNIRIILVDDGSADMCPTICDNYADLDDRIVSIHRKNGGISAARNTGLDFLFSKLSEDDEFVAFVDPDDWVESSFVEFLFRLLIENDAQIAQCGHFISYSDTDEVTKVGSCHTQILNRREAIESLCRNDTWDVTLWNKLYYLNVFQGLRFPVGRLYEDTAASYLLASHAAAVAVNMTPQYHYMQRYTSIANGDTWRENKLDLIDAGDNMADWVSKQYPDLIAAAMEKRVFVRLSTLSQMVNCNYSGKHTIKKLRRFIMHNAKTVLSDPSAMKRDKIGIVVLASGWLNYRIIWKIYYTIQRHRRTKFFPERNAE